ncbi:hypothetical protein [Phenylobacterium sp.]|uniref:hypothetical protein n=1 Tax=Phenylobacterium sp. TaxID=1871053 RepID=UPI002B9992B4|nr:hypothetical protein [Phenylobacterium sp.]HVI32692.1 hypothetical protein [Phenylobacterium sp.]
MTTLRIPALIALLGTAALVSGCGKMGALERPGPLFGNESATTREADEAQRQAQDPTRPVDTVDPRDRTTDPAPSRSIPIQGQSPNPTEPAPQGALPDPYANPRR